MTTLQEIERAIGELSRGEIEDLYAWLDDHYLRHIDEQLRSALDAGQLDERITRALSDHEAGRTRPL